MKLPHLFPAIAGALTLMVIASAGPASAQGEPRYGTRAIHVCGPPVRTQPNAQQIAALVQCNFEKKSNDRISLMEAITVQAGGLRAYNQFSDGYASGIDTSAKVLPIRGSLTTYQCNVISKPGPVRGPYDTDNSGKNCLVVRQPKAEGKCYKTTFGDWWCGMSQQVPPEDFLMNQAPPTSR